MNRTLYILVYTYAKWGPWKWQHQHGIPPPVWGALVKSQPGKSSRQSSEQSFVHSPRQTHQSWPNIVFCAKTLHVIITLFYNKNNKEFNSIPTVLGYTDWHQDGWDKQNTLWQVGVRQLTSGDEWYGRILNGEVRQRWAVHYMYDTKCSSGRGGKS